MTPTNTTSPHLNIFQQIWARFAALSVKTKLIAGIAVALLIGGTIIMVLVLNSKEPLTPKPDNTTNVSFENPSTPQNDPSKSDKTQPSTPGATTPPATGGTVAPKAGGSSTAGGTTAPPPPSGGSTPTPPPPTSTRPSASNTGFPAGTSFTNYSGPAENNTSNVTYDGVNFPTPGAPGWYTFNGNNLVFKNCRIYGGMILRGDNIRMEHCEIIGGMSLSGVAGGVVEYNNIHSFDDGIHITSDTGQVSNITVSNNFVHAPAPSCDDHSDGMQVRGVAGLTLTNNVFDMGPWFQVCGKDALNGAVFFENTQGGNSNVTLDGNYLNGGGYILRLNTGVNQKFINNRFGPDGHYGVVLNNAAGGTITQWSGNVMDANGATVNP